MKKSLKKAWAFMPVAGVVLLALVLGSCEKEEQADVVQIQTLEEVIEKDNKGVVNTSDAQNRSSCDCDLILQADISGEGNVSTLDLVLLQQIILYLDYDGDGCVTYQDGTISADVAGWFADGKIPDMFFDYTLNGTIDGLDVRQAFYYAEQFGAITGSASLCMEDLECLRKYILGVIVC